MRGMSEMYISCIILSLIISFFYTNALSAEFAYFSSLKALQSESGGNGFSAAFGYGGFGLNGSLEYKNYEAKSFMAAYAGLNFPARLELGLSALDKLRLSIRGGVNIPTIPALSLTTTYEKFFGNNDFSGFQLGIELLIYD